MRLIIKQHAIDKAIERIYCLMNSSEKYAEKWLKKMVPLSNEIFLGLKLYSKLERTYNKGEHKPIVYRRDDFGIYILELVRDDIEILRSVQEPNFRRNAQIKIPELIGEQFRDLLNLRENLPQMSV